MRAQREEAWSQQHQGGHEDVGALGLCHIRVQAQLLQQLRQVV